MIVHHQVPLCEECGAVIMPLLWQAPEPFSVFAEQLFMERIARRLARCTSGCAIYTSLVRQNTSVERPAWGF